AHSNRADRSKSYKKAALRYKRKAGADRGAQSTNSVDNVVENGLKAERPIGSLRARFRLVKKPSKNHPARRVFASGAESLRRAIHRRRSAAPTRRSARR